MFFCQFRMPAKQGYLFLPLEMMLGGLFWIWNSEKKQISFNAVSIYAALSIYRIILTFIMAGISFDNIKIIVYREVGMLFICYMYVSKNSCCHYIITVLRNIGFLISVLGCYEFITKSSLFTKFITVESRIYFQSVVGTSAARSSIIFIHPIICGVYETTFWLCTIFFPYKKAWMNYLAKIVILIALLGTQSRSSWVSFLIVNALYLWLKKDRKNIRIKESDFLIGILFLSVVSGIVVVNWRKICQEASVLLNRMLASFDSTHSGNYNRMTMIKVGLTEWKNADLAEKLFGFGNGYALSYLKAHSIKGWSTAVDNQYLTILLDNGLIGLLILLALIIYVFNKIRCCNNKIKQLSGFVIISMFISGFFYEMFTWITVTFLFCLFIGMLECDGDEIV